MAAVEVQVPPGLYEGDTFVVSTADGQEFNVIVPPGCAEGSLLTVGDAPMGGPQPFEVQVPDGLLAGDAFLVAMENGQELEVFVPDGCQGGDIILVDLPAPPSQTARRCHPVPAAVAARVATRERDRGPSRRLV